MIQPLASLGGLGLSVCVLGKVLAHLGLTETIKFLPLCIGPDHFDSSVNSGNSSWRGSSCDESDRRRLRRSSERRRLKPLLATSCFVGQSLALDAGQRAVGAGQIVDAELGARVVSEIELGEIAVEMLFLDVLVDAD